MHPRKAPSRPALCTPEALDLLGPHATGPFAQIVFDRLDEIVAGAPMEQKAPEFARPAG